MKTEEDKKIKFCDKCGEAYQTDRAHECITTATLCRDLILSLKIRDRPNWRKKDLIAEIEINKDNVTNVSVQVKKMIEQIESLWVKQS